MCGIAGFLGPPDRPVPLLEAAFLAAQRHRGPDEQGRLSFRSRDGVLGQLVSTRLAIVDLSADGSQPMRSADGRLSLCFNGEIYNHQALRRELQAKGAQFHGHSDTEVILVGYARLGDRLWPRLRGMYALALWDADLDELRLLRDPMGQKPLYICSDGQTLLPFGKNTPQEVPRLCFASEVRTLLQAQAVPRRIDPAALTGFLTWGSVPEPHSVVAGVQPLPPGQLVRVRPRLHHQDARLQILPPQPIEPPSPVDLRLATDPRGSSDRIAMLREALADTVRCHLQGDVPVGILLSGGVDSTSLAAWARATAPQQDLLAFTLATGLPGSDDEVAQARATAKALRLGHHVADVRSLSTIDRMGRWLAAMDQPSVDGGNTFLICEQVHQHGCKVALSGAGGDELFLGYGLHRRFAAAWAALSSLPRALHPPAAEDLVAAWLYQRQRRLFAPWALAGLLAPGLGDSSVPQPIWQATWITGPIPSSVDDGAGGEGRAAGLLRVQALELQNYLRNTLLRDGDVLSMAHSVELRVPLCDPWLWRLLQQIDPIVPSGQRQKSLLWAAAPPGDRCVAQAAQQPKRGFDLPLDAWLRGPLRAGVEAQLLDGNSLIAAGLQPKSVRLLWSLYVAMERSPAAIRHRLAHRIWALYVWLAYVQRQALRFDWAR